ncbi:MAG: AEC family transporter [Bacteroidales bacterium]|nr:AEC family transporter [Bacteroidales bacterium]
MAFQATLETMVIFFLLLATGVLMSKLGVIKKEGMGQFSLLITKLFLPVMIFYTVATSITLNLISENAVLFPLSAGIYITLAVVAFLVAKIMRIEKDKDRVFQFAFIFGNTGFVGFPLFSTVFNEIGTLFMCLFSVVDQLLFWTYGIWLSTARGKANARFNIKMLVSPNIVAIVLGVVVGLSGLTLPGVIDSALSIISRAATPMCMLFLGAMICFNKVGQIIKRLESYILIAIKMLVLPVGTGFLCTYLGLSAEIAGCAALYVALPVMTVVPMISEQNGSEGAYATGIAIMTFVACVVTIPVVAFLVL